MTTRLYTAPVEEPISLTEAKAHLRIEHDLDNEFISTIIKAAREYAELVCWRGFVTQTWEVVNESFPAGTDAIILPKGALASVTSVKYLEDVAGVETTLATTEYLVDLTSTPPRVRLAFDKSWPNTRPQYNAVVVRYVIGWEPAAVPAPIKAAIMLLAGHMYEYRVPEVLGTIIAKVSFSFEHLLAPYRLRRF